MTKPSLAILTMAKATRELFEYQLREMLTGKVEMYGYSLEEGLEEPVNGGLVLTTSLVKDEIDNNIVPDAEYLVANRALQLSSLDKLLKIPVGTRALLVCSTAKSAVETAVFLQTVGINHIEYFPHVPGEPRPEVDLAITTGKRKDVPAGLKIVDIHKRQLGISTIIQVLLKFDLIASNADRVIANHVKRLVGLSQRLNNEVVEVTKANSMLQLVMDHVSDGIIYFNEDQEIKFNNNTAGEVFNIKGNKNIYTARMLYKTDIDAILNKNEKLVNYIHRTEKDRDVVTSIYPVFERHENIGALAITRDITELKNLEETLRRKLKDKGHVAKYSFDNIIGKSEKIEQIKRRAANIACSESTVLIQGETGTGKELFAQAIHNSSKRGNRPFIAINCATIPEDLFESELFGYAEGAFTGAARKGKPGVFEKAHRGTIFLDEIGDIPPSIQIKLLRVLQEKEVMRVGSTRIVPVDVRVIVATNKNLEELITKGLFREDLYYRINVLPLYIPPLRERKEDILPLIDYFLQGFASSELTFLPDAVSKLYNYDWPGNIRQLRNCIECVSQICQDQVAVSDLPDYLLQREREEDRGVLPGERAELKNKILDFKNPEEYIFILRELYLAKQLEKNIGRRQIARSARVNNLELNPQMVRNRIKKLEELELVRVGRGRQGTKITEKGIKAIKGLASF